MKFVEKLKRNLQVSIFRDSWITSAHVFQNRWSLGQGLLREQSSYLALCLSRYYTTPPFNQARRFWLLFFYLRLVLIVFATMPLEFSLAFTLSSDVLWRLTQGCRLPAPCQTGDIILALEMSEQYSTVIGTQLHVSSTFTSIPNPPYASSLSESKSDKIDRPSLSMRSSCAILQQVRGITSSVGTLSDYRN